ALSSNEGELARSISTCEPAMASLSPSPLMVLIPPWGEAATRSWPPWRRMATVFEPIRPVPPLTTIFMVDPLLCLTRDIHTGEFANLAFDPDIEVLVRSPGAPPSSGQNKLLPLRRSRQNARRYNSEPSGRQGD